MNPLAKANLLFEELDDETLVYDLDRHRVHSLSPLAAFLLRQASGQRDISELADAAEAAFGGVVPDEVVEFGIRRLGRARLLEGDPQDEDAAPLRGTKTRREALLQLAVVGLAIPTVLTVVTPTPTQAATMVTNQQCRRNGSASAGKCCTNHKTCVLDDPRRNRYKCKGPRC